MPRPLVWGFVGLLLFMVGDGVESGYIAPFLASNGAGNETQAAVIITAYGLIVTLDSWLPERSDTWGPRRVMLLGLAIWAVFEVLFLAIAVPSQNYTLILITYAIRGFGYPLFAYGFLVWILAGSPANRLGSAVGWFYFAFTGGLPTLGSLMASGTFPIIGEYTTLWISLLMVAAGGVVCLVGIRKAKGGDRLAAPGVTARQSIVSSVSIAVTFLSTSAGVLAPDATVVAGGHDHPIGGWAVDQLQPGAILDSMGTAEVVVAPSPTPNVPRFGNCDVGPGILSEGSTPLTVTELARNVDWTSLDPAVAAALQAIIDGSEKPDEYLHSESFIPGAQGSVRPRYAPDAPAAALSRASAVAGALARAGDAAIEAVASRMPPPDPRYTPPEDGPDPRAGSRSNGRSSKPKYTSSPSLRSPPSVQHCWQLMPSTGTYLPALRCPLKPPPSKSRRTHQISPDAHSASRRREALRKTMT